MYDKEQETIVSVYKSRIDSFEKQLSESRRKSTKFSYIRLGFFVLAFPLAYFLSTIHFTAVIGGLLAVIAVFIWAVLKQQKYDLQVRALQQLITINWNEINSISTFSNIYYDGGIFEKAHHFYTADLDIFGPNSLYALINRSKTYDGIYSLSQLFLELPTRNIIVDRQEAVEELTHKLDWRQNFAASLFEIEDGQSRDLAAEIDGELQLDLDFAQGKLLDRYRLALPFIWLGIVAMYFVDSNIANSIAPVVFIFNLLLTLRKSQETTNVQNHLSYASIMLRSYKRALDIIFSEEWESDLLKTNVDSFREKSKDTSAVKVISELQTIIEQLDYRLNFIVAIILNGLILWDFRVLKRLEKWLEKNRGKLNELFDFIGLMEASSSLATYAYNNPNYSYPRITDTYFSLNAVAIEHPLIPAKQSVGNDFKIEKGGHLNIITGSNMSGKSTLLRTIGINMILGYTGSPVAAQKLEFPIVKIISYMRIKDILEESVSTFKAELNRIQMILDILKEYDNCFILIDEMLRGTNSKDKLTGSIGIAKRLLSEKTYAMIATHDIKLAELGTQFQQGIQNYYFDIDYADGDLVFDYKVKEGICENFNASFLLGQLGIEMEN